MNVCSECGKEFDVLYPDLWRYRTGTRWFCSWHCLRADERKRKEDYGMARLKKDGTQAKRPGPKKAEPVQCIAHVDPADLEEAMKDSIQQGLTLQGGVNYQLKVEEDRKEPEFKYTVTGIGTEVGVFRVLDDGSICWETSSPQMYQPKPHVYMLPGEWKDLIKILPEALRVLGVK